MFLSTVRVARQLYEHGPFSQKESRPGKIKISDRRGSLNFKSFQTPTETKSSAKFSKVLITEDVIKVHCKHLAVHICALWTFLSGTIPEPLREH
jgi:hypothetical protein